MPPPSLAGRRRVPAAMSRSIGMPPPNGATPPGPWDVSRSGETPPPAFFGPRVNSRGAALTTTIAARAGIPNAQRQENQVTRRSEEHTSELQSRENLVCRLLLEKKKKNILDGIV